MAPNTMMPKVLFAGGIAGFSYYMVMRKYWFPDPKTTAVQNIENRFASAGGQPTHQPGTATKRGISAIPLPSYLNRQWLTVTTGTDKDNEPNQTSRAVSDQKSEVRFPDPPFPVWF